MRDRIFDAVVAELLSGGIDRFNVADVARRAGVDRQVIDRHWSDGRVLLMEALLARAGDAVPIPDQGSLSRDLRQLVSALAELTDTGADRELFRRLVPGGRDLDVSEVGSDFWAFQLAAVEQILHRAAERGELRTDIDKGKATRMLAAALAYDVVFHDNPMHPDYADQVCSIFLHGMLTSDRSGLVEDLQDSERIGAVLRATCDGVIDPIALVEAVRDSDGGIFDFVFREVNPAACTYLRRTRTELLGASLAETLPDLAASGLFAQYGHAMEAGDPLEVEDFVYFSQRYQTMRRFDLRGMPVSADWLSMVWRDVSDRYRTQQHAVGAARLIAAGRSGAGTSPEELADIATAEALRIAADALLDPQVLLEAARDPSGQIVDFVYREVNQATCDYLGLAREELLGRGVLETMPGLKETLFTDYIRCLNTGEPVIRNDFAYDNEILRDTRRYDLRATRATAHSLTLTWRDVTDRFRAAQDLARSRDLLRAATDAMFNPQALVELITSDEGEVDLVLRDVNNAFCDYIDQQRTDLVGQSMLALFPNVVGAGLFENYVRCAETGEPVILDDVEYFTEFIYEPRRFDIRAAQVDDGLISITLRDTTTEFEAAQRLADSEQRYRLLAENAGDIVIQGHNGKFVWVSPAIETVLGAPPEHWIGREISEIVPSEDRAAFAERLRVLEEGGTIQRRGQVISVDGATHWVHLRAAPFYDADGRQAGFTSAVRVIDDEVAAENAAAEARVQQARADALHLRSMESAAVGMCLARPEGAFLQVNDAICEFFGYHAEALLEKTWIELTAPEYLRADLDKVADLVAGRVDSYRMVKQFIHADGHRLWGDLSVGCLRREDGSVEVTIAQIIDITAQVEAEQRLERLARVDTLTGLANRAEAIARMESALEPTRNPGSHLGVLFCDIDGFKAINDTLGHAFGDLVLTTLASRVRQCVRDGDTVGRMGGDEMLVLLPGMHNIDDAIRIAEKIRRHVSEPIQESGRTIKVTLSIGAVLAASGQTASTILARADAAMYQAKARRDAVISIT